MTVHMSNVTYKKSITGRFFCFGALTLACKCDMEGILTQKFADVATGPKLVILVAFLLPFWFQALTQIFPKLY